MTDEQTDAAPAEEDRPPQQAPDAAEKSPGPSVTPGKGLAGWFAGAALVLSLAALAGVGASAWAWYQLRGEQARIAALEGRVSALDGRLAGLQQSAAQSKNLEALHDRVVTLARAQRSSDAAYSARINALSARLSTGVLSYRLDEAAALMRLAQSRLEVGRDAGASLRALELADQVLASTHASGLTPVRESLAGEIQAVKAVPRPDIAGAVARLGAVAATIEGLPLAGEHFEKPASASTSPTPEGWSWQGLGQAFKRAFSQLVVVRRGPEARPLLPPREAYFVRENVKLALVSARAALLERDPASYRASLEQARGWLERWFDTSNAGVKAADSTLQKLAGLNVNPALPTLGQALKRLQQIRSEQHGS